MNWKEILYLQGTFITNIYLRMIPKETYFKIIFCILLDINLKNTFIVLPTLNYISTTLFTFWGAIPVFKYCPVSETKQTQRYFQWFIIITNINYLGDQFPIFRQ